MWKMVVIEILLSNHCTINNICNRLLIIKNTTYCNRHNDYNIKIQTWRKSCLNAYIYIYIYMYMWVLNVTINTPLYVNIWKSVTELLSYIYSNSLCGRLLTIKHVICGLRCLRYGGLRYGGYIYIYKYIYWYVDVSAQRNNRDPTTGEYLGVGAESEECIPLLCKRRSDHPARPHSFDWSGWNPICGRRSELGVCDRVHVSYRFEQSLQQTPHHKTYHMWITMFTIWWITIWRIYIHI